MKNYINTPKYDEFSDKNNKRTILIVLSFIFIFILTSILENNLFLPGKSFGLFEHINIWFFLVANIIVPIAINKSYKILTSKVDVEILNKLKKEFQKISHLPAITVLYGFLVTIGFCCLVGNTLQNADVINQLPFDYWDSSKYSLSFAASRIYKLYLFAYYIPTLTVYITIVMQSISALLVVDPNKMNKFPLDSHMQLNALCNFGLNILLVFAISATLMMCNVFFIHHRLDITSITTAVLSFSVTLSLLLIYFWLVRKYHADIVKYKKRNIESINKKLSEIYQYNIHYQFDETKEPAFESGLKNNEYLKVTREEIIQIAEYPHIHKAIFTSLFPSIPTLVQLIFTLTEHLS